MTHYTPRERTIALESKSFGEYRERYLSEMEIPQTSAEYFVSGKRESIRYGLKRRVIER